MCFSSSLRDASNNDKYNGKLLRVEDITWSGVRGVGVFTSEQHTMTRVKVNVPKRVFYQIPLLGDRADQRAEGKILSENVNGGTCSRQE